MRLSKLAKRVVSLAVALTVTATSISVPQVAKKAEAASGYKAYMCLATGEWTFRNQHDDSKFSNKLQNTTNELKKNSAKFTDVSMSKKGGTYTVKLTGLKAGVISNDKTFNSLYVDTTIPGTKVKTTTFTNVTVKFDGKTVKTFKKGVTTPESGTDGFVQLQIINTWNSKVPKFKYSMPKKSIEITYTVKIK